MTNPDYTSLVARQRETCAQRTLPRLVQHDAAECEYDYGMDSKVGTFSDALMTEVKKRGWTVISTRSDWKRIFTFER